ncbi:MAG TPA: rhodanese-like domain-containing protein [Pyrinomonadaceae bacterium]|jgi:3-mercaptopyruvate sulfurtransferase SseA|nr:rhodanese-like domain-containing protein [Pyrinomonadaceae bacterium]
MRLFVSLAAVAIILAALALTACNSKDGSGSSAARSSGSANSSSAAPPTTAPDGVQRITTAELRDALEKGTAMVVDVRSPESYKSGHIKGSINIPETEIARRKDELPRDRKIVLYCS